jgi:hypothetical protein
MNASIKIISLTLVLLGAELPLGAQDPTPPETSTPATSAQAAPAPAPPAQAAPVPPLFTSDRLEQMAAPIALYPDALVAQILMASTYPLEIVEAARWVEKNPELKGAALEEALKQNEWDPSVKALCGFPTVLKKMNDHLSWTKDLGDAFLAQKVELMDTIQQMRHKALDAGTLKTTDQQRVTQDDGKIVIQPANPEVIYVPTYAPAVYGPGWYYPTYYYPGWYDPWWGIGIAFGIGFFWGSGCWSSCDWHNHCCNVNCDQLNTFNAHTSAPGTRASPPTTAGGTTTWHHDPAHRAGVDYRSPQVAHEFGAAPGSTRVASTRASGSPNTSPMGDTRGGATGSDATRGAPSGPGTRGLSGTTSSADHGRMPPTDGRTPPMDRSSTAPVSQRSGPASGRMTSDPSRGFGRSTTTAMSGHGSGVSSAPSSRGSPRTSSGSTSSYRGRGVPSAGSRGFHTPSPGGYSGGWSGTSRGSSTTFGRGWHSAGSFGGMGRSSGSSFGSAGRGFGGSFGGGGRGGGGFGGGGFHGGGHR